MVVGGDSRSGASEAAIVRMVVDPCVLVVGPGAGGDTSQNVADHGEKGDLKTSIFVAKKGIQFARQRRSRWAQVAPDSERKQLWDMMCWIAELVMYSDEVRRTALSSTGAVHFGRVLPLCVEKHSGLPPEKRKHKGRVVYGVLCLGPELECRSDRRARVVCIFHAGIEVGRYCWMPTGMDDAAVGCATGLSA